jgi:hypothetical protein
MKFKKEAMILLAVLPGVLSTNSNSNYTKTDSKNITQIKENNTINQENNKNYIITDK